MKKFLTFVFYIFLVSASIFLVFFFQNFRNPQKSTNNQYETKMVGISMLPTIKDNDLIKIIKRDNSTNIQHNTLVVFTVQSTPKAYDTVKRVIGVEGDQVMIKGGILYLNKSKLEEKYLFEQGKTQSGSFLKEGESVIVPKGSVFVMGDNRDHSVDSRIVGFVKINEILGVLVQ